MRRITHVLWIIVALIFLLEAWLWAKLAPIVAFLVWLVPLQPIKSRIAAAIEGLPPAATLVVFVIPVAVLFPIKLAALWAFGHGHWIAGIVALVFAKLARSEEHTSELHHVRISYAVFCLKKKKQKKQILRIKKKKKKNKKKNKKNQKP